MKVTEESFLKDVGKHAMTVLRDDGVYRHLHFAIPGSGHMHFDVVTYPHYLCYSGDMGCYVFSRIDDMFQFFRGKEAGPLRINEGYWSEKLEATSKTDGHYEYSSEKLESHVKEWLDDVEADDELRDRIKDEVLNYSQDGEHPARQAMFDFKYEKRHPFQESWECNFSEYTHRFIWCCYAIAWGIRQYDLSKATVQTVPG